MGKLLVPVAGTVVVSSSKILPKGNFTTTYCKPHEDSLSITGNSGEFPFNFQLFGRIIENVTNL